MRTVDPPELEAEEFDKKLWQAVCLIRSRTHEHFANPNEIPWSDTQYRASGDAVWGLRRGLYQHVYEGLRATITEPEQHGDRGPNTFGTRPPTEAFLDEVYEFQDSNDVRGGIRHIFSRMNAWLMDGHFQICDAILRKVDVNRLSVDLALSFLTITRAARHELANRAAYIDRACQRITAIRGPAVAKRLLENMAD